MTEVDVAILGEEKIPRGRVRQVTAPADLDAVGGVRQINRKDRRRKKDGHQANEPPIDPMLSGSKKMRSDLSHKPGVNTTCCCGLRRDRQVCRHCGRRRGLDS